MRPLPAIAGSALFFVAAPCVVAGLAPFLLTDRYHLPLSTVPIRGSADLEVLFLVAARTIVARLRHGTEATPRAQRAVP